VHRQFLGRDFHPLVKVHHHGAPGGLELKAGAADVEIEAIEPIDRTARVLQVPELFSIPSDGSEQ